MVGIELFVHLGRVALALELGLNAGQGIIKELDVSLLFGLGARKAETPWTNEIDASIGWPFDVHSTGLRHSLAEDSQPWRGEGGGGTRGAG